MDGIGQAGKVEVWTPFAFANIWSESERGGRGFGAIGRLKPGVSVEQAEADLATIAWDLPPPIRWIKASG